MQKLKYVLFISHVKSLSMQHGEARSVEGKSFAQRFYHIYDLTKGVYVITIMTRIRGRHQHIETNLLAKKWVKL